MSGVATRTSKTDQIRSRAIDGRYEKKCGCIQHDLFYSSGHSVPYSLSSFKVKAEKSRKTYLELVKRKLITKKTAWVCSRCINYAKLNLCTTASKLPSPSESTHYSGGPSAETDSEPMETEPDGAGVEKTELDDGEMEPDDDEDEMKPDHYGAGDQREDRDTAFDLSEELDKIFCQLKNVRERGTWQTFNTKQRSQLADISIVLGSLIESDLYEDSLEVTKETNNTNADLKDIDKEEWIGKRNCVLVGFLTGCAKTSVQNQEEKKTNALIHAVEQVLKLRNLLTVSPFGFQRNIVQYVVSGSKLATNLMGSWEPGGSYTKVSQYIRGPIDPPTIPDGDIHIAVDNEQRVGKTSGRIREGSTIRLDICTTMSCIQSKESKGVQSKMELKPESWRTWDSSDDREALIKKVEEEEDNAMRVFRQYRQHFIEEVIAEVDEELGSDMQDHVDIAMAQAQRGHRNYVCSKCKFVNADSGICANCKHDPNQYPLDYDVYHRTPSCHPEDPPRVMVAEPCLVNPNTKTNVKTVMQHVQEHCQLGEHREWVYLWCDAVPYLLGCKLTDALTCVSCGEEVTRSEMKSHSEVHHNGNDSEVEFQQLFGNIFLRPGPGHIELNMARSLLKLLWEPYMQHFAVLLGFRSPRAQLIIHNGVDHHRSRQILRTLLHALSKELIRPYVLEQRAKGQDANIERYFDWFNAETCNPNCLFAWRVCFRYLLAFQLYTESVRKNNNAHMLAARAAFSPLFYARNHPRYRELHLRDMLDRIQCPTELREDIEAHESFSVSGIHNRGQGSDFIHEEVNRTVKSLLPPGAVTPEIWTRVCRKADMLTDMKKRCLLSAGLKSAAESGEKAPKKHELEEAMVRREMRTANLLDSPSEQKELTSLSGEMLDYDLPNMVHTIQDSYDEYKKDFVETGTFGGVKLSTCLYVTTKERQYGEAIENKTKDEIKTEIVTMIREAGLDQCEASLGKLKKSTPKAQYLKVYYEVVEVMEEEYAKKMAEEEEDDN